MVFGSRLALFRQLAEVINATDIINLFKSFGPVKKFDWIYDVLHTKLEVYNPNYYKITFGVERQNSKYYLHIVCLFNLVFRHFGSPLALAEVINASDIINLFKSLGPVKKFDWIYDILHTKLEVYNPNYYNITFGVGRQNLKSNLHIVCLFHLVLRHFGSRLALFRPLAEVIHATDIVNLFRSFGPVKKFDWIYDALHTTKLKVYNVYC